MSARVTPSVSLTERVADLMDAFPAYRHDEILRLPLRTFAALEAQAARLRRRRLADHAVAVGLALAAVQPQGGVARRRVEALAHGEEG